MATNDNGNYSVGYKRPPRDKQFQKGRSGNPRGPRPGARSLHALVRKVLNERLLVIENGKRKKLPKLDAIIKQFAKKALNGDLASARFLLTIIGAAEERDGRNDRPLFMHEARRILDELDDPDDLPNKPE